jgi:hypothetical protein
MLLVAVGNLDFIGSEIPAVTGQGCATNPQENHKPGGVKPMADHD